MTILSIVTTKLLPLLLLAYFCTIKYVGIAIFADANNFITFQQAIWLFVMIQQMEQVKKNGLCNQRFMG